MLDRKVEDYDASEELLIDRKKQAKGMVVLQGIFGIFTLLIGLLTLHTPGMKIIDGLVLMILSLIPMMLFVGYYLKVGNYDVLIRLERQNIENDDHFIYKNRIYTKTKKKNKKVKKTEVKKQ